MLAKNKSSNIETLISQVLIVAEISHKEFIAIVDEKEEYEKMKENIKTISFHGFTMIAIYLTKF